LANDLDLSKLATIGHEISRDKAIESAEKLLAGEIRGRVIVDVN
jgi:acrylyl-CoA reductase (NADPH)